VTAELVVDDLRLEDFDGLASWNSPSHLNSMRGYLARCEQGECEYLVVRDLDGAVLSKGCVEYTESPGAGTLIQLSTISSHEGRGLMTMLIAAAEARIRARGLRRACLAVEPDNTRARRLYDHLGYVAFGERETGWEQEPGVWYSTTVVDMAKVLAWVNPRGRTEEVEQARPQLSWWLARASVIRASRASLASLGAFGTLDSLCSRLGCRRTGSDRVHDCGLIGPRTPTSALLVAPFARALCAPVPSEELLRGDADHDLVVVLAGGEDRASHAALDLEPKSFVDAQ
jgi:ribosomal protein S18 acetylase RimI-like enzyme